MKKNLLFAFIALACPVMSCSVDELADEIRIKEDASVTVDTYNADMQLLSRWGYDTTSVQIFDEYYLVSNELVFYKDELKASRSVPQTKMNAETTRLTKTQQQIRLDKSQMDVMSNSDMLLEEAISEWNSIDDCNLFFSTTGAYPTEASAAIEVTSTPSFAFGSALVTVTPLIGSEWQDYH